MAQRSDQQLRLTVYGTIGVILLIGGVIFFQFLHEAENASKTLSEAVATDKKDYENLDTAVLNSEKFKKLEAIVMPVAPDKPLPSSDELSDEELAKLPRKKNNPFIPSF